LLQEFPPKRPPNPQGTDNPGNARGAHEVLAFASVKAPGALLAAGRDADIFEYGPGLVLRRSRNGRSLAHEAQIMEYLAEQGYPVPRIAEVSDDGCDLVMERIEGPSMGDYLAKAPWAMRRQAGVLAALHRQLHEVAIPGFLRPAPVGRGTNIVHLDLHPLNVIVGRNGPVVIDWTNVARGDPAVDVALVWVLVLAGEIPKNPIAATMTSLGRRLFVNGFIADFDQREVFDCLADVVAWKAQDSHMSPREVRAMWRLVERGRQLRHDG